MAPDGKVARASRITRWLAIARVLTAAAVVAAGCTPSPSNPVLRPQIRYVALGDSFSSGEGVEPFSPDPASGQDPECHQSRDAYARVVEAQSNGRMRLVGFFACSGATTANIVETPQHSGQLPQVASLATVADVDLVTLTVGGNDIGFKTFAENCVGHPDHDCAVAYATATAKLEKNLPGALKQTYAVIGETVGPKARVLVLGYPYITPFGTGVCELMSDVEIGLARKLTRRLNEIVSVGVREAGSKFEFLDPTEAGSPFLGHGLCTSEPFFNGPLDRVPPHPAAYMFHPNRLGQQAYATMVLGRLANRSAAASPTPTGESTMTVGPTVTASSTPALPPLATTVDWRNTTLRSNCADQGHDLSVTIHNGIGTAADPNDPTAATTPYEFRVTATANGDLTGDGRPEVAVALTCIPPNTNFFVWEIQVFTDGPAKLTRLVIPPLPDALYKAVNPVDSEFSIDGRRLRVGVMYYGPNDCHACGPSIHRVLYLRWNGQQLVKA